MCSAARRFSVVASVLFGSVLLLAVLASEPDEHAGPPATARRAVAAPAVPPAPEPTCAVPAPAAATRAMLPPVPQWPAATQAEAERAIDAVLLAWESASNRLVPLTSRERERAAHLYRDRRSGHELAVMFELRGPVEADELQRRYRWTCVESEDGRLLLTAVPREVEERLFVREFQVTLDAVTRLPRSVSFVDADVDGAPRSEEIRLVTWQADRPLVRTAENAEFTTSIGNGRPPMQLDSPIVPRVLSDEQVAGADVETAGQELSSEIAAILRDWEQAFSGVQRFEAEFVLLTNDRTSGTSHREMGRLLLVAPNRGRIDLRAVTSGPPASGEPQPPPAFDEASPGRPARLVQRWYWTGTEFLAVDEVARTFERYALPSATSAALELQNRGNLVPARPQDVLPLVFEIKAAEISKRYQLSLLGKSERAIRLAAVPRRPEDLPRYRRIEVELDAQTYRPTVVQLVDSQGRGEMVYFLRDIVVNRPPAAGDDPLRPQLAGYRERKE